VLFNDTVMYNIAYGGIKDPEFKKMVDNESKEEELIQMIKPSSVRA